MKRHKGFVWFMILLLVLIAALLLAYIQAQIIPTPPATVIMLTS